MYRVEFVLRGEVAFEADVDLPALEEEEQLQEQNNQQNKTRGRKPGKRGAVAPQVPVVSQSAVSKNNKNKKTQPPPPPPPQSQKKGQIASRYSSRRRKGQHDDDLLEEESEKPYKEEQPQKKLKKGKKQVVDSDIEADEEDEEEMQGSEDEAKLLELEGELEEELAHLGEDGEDVDNFEEDDENEELEKLERYATNERPIAKLSQRFKDLENLSDSNLSEDPNYQKLTKRQKNIVKNNMSGQVETEYLQLPNQSSRKKNKFVTEEDQMKKIEKEEKRRAQMQKQIEDLKRQTVDKILNEAGTKQKKRKEKEEIEKDNKINHQYRKLPQGMPRIRILNNSQGSIVSITKTAFHPLLNPFPVVFENNLMGDLESQTIQNEDQNLSQQQNVVSGQNDQKDNESNNNDINNKKEIEEDSSKLMEESS
ncbi:PAPA-like motif protein (macronuclear) [Tetrahymena thermophila SB210]|uniref:PAPA-like motif protein n=1 Tax=Tetrahymena thermophila (strain SB210) TaxID=312017 RepID=Q22GD9_TETTS|nr:PAPA-like motif protein [Tetrahymena thermophila SB210]EAR84392.2 PAPA-like motif protein [Tetrahymena thermophila SB210]|eukprot:XP_001032055.2 PAPA-like motif protein [Tetrahymena thermophila SB210]